MVTTGAVSSAGGSSGGAERVSLPTWLLPGALNQMAPSGPLAMPVGIVPSPTGISVISPPGVIGTTAPAPPSVNHALRQSGRDPVQAGVGGRHGVFGDPARLRSSGRSCSRRVR